MEDISEALEDEITAGAKQKPSTTGQNGATANGKDHTSSETGANRLLLALPEDCRRLIGRMVELAPACRITIDEVLNDSWLKSVNMCTVEESSPGVFELLNVKIMNILKWINLKPILQLLKRIRRNRIGGNHYEDHEHLRLKINPIIDKICSILLFHFYFC